MAVALTMAHMKVAILRNSITGQRASFVVTGGLLGLVLAAGTIFLVFLSPDLLVVAYAVWMMGWIFGPAFAGGGDETLRPEYFTLVGLPPRRLAAGLLVSAFIGVAPVVSLVALGGLVVFAVRQGVGPALVALPALVLQLAAFVLLSKVAVAVLGVALRSRVGAIGAGVVNGLILAVLGQGWVFFLALGETGGIPPVVATAARMLPSGWGLVAVESAGAGDWVRAAAALGGLAVLIALLLGGWAALLTRRAGASRGATRGRMPMRATTASGAVLAKELRTWSRDLLRTHQLTFSLAYGVFFAAMPLVLGWNVMLPWAGPIFILMATAMSANLYGSDGTALWLTVMTPGAHDVRGRQRAWLLTVAPLALALSIGLNLLVGGPWPVLLALSIALLGGGAGLVPLMSVYALVPGVDPHKRSGNPLRSTEDDGAITGLAYAVLALTALTAAPAALAAIWYGWAGVAVALVTGLLCYWGFGLLAQRKLDSDGPELLDLMRTGKRLPSENDRWTRFDDLTRTEKIVAMVCWSTGAIPLFPQGIVAGIMLATGSEERSWFLALHMPPGLQWPTVFFMVLLGASMYGLGVLIPYRHHKRSREEG